MVEFAIISVDQTSRFDTEKGAQLVYVITFSVKDKGRFTVEVPAEGYTASKGRDAAQAVAREIYETLGA